MHTLCIRRSWLQIREGWLRGYRRGVRSCSSSSWMNISKKLLLRGKIKNFRKRHIGRWLISFGGVILIKRMKNLNFGKLRFKFRFIKKKL